MDAFKDYKGIRGSNCIPRPPYDWWNFVGVVIALATSAVIVALVIMGVVWLVSDC